MWTALIDRCLYSARNVHYPGMLERTACGMESTTAALLLMSRDLRQVTCRRCQATWRFKLGT